MRSGWSGGRAGAAGLAALTFALSAGAPVLARPDRGPVVVELYTAQGCDDCAEADKLVGALQQRPGVLPLTFSVDYFDYFGWKDTFAQPEFGDRQSAYVKRLKVRDIYTPEVVVGGAAEAPGGDAEQIEALIKKARAARPADAPALVVNRRGTRVQVKGGEGAGELWLVRYDPHPRTVKVKGDDRKTRLVTAYNVVRELVRLGPWRGRARSYPLPAPKGEGLATVVLLQGRSGGPILAASHG